MPSALRSKAGQRRLLFAIGHNARRFAMGKVDDQDIEDIVGDIVLHCLRKIRSRKWRRVPANVQALVRKLTSDRIADVRRRRRVQNGLTREFLRGARPTDRHWMSADCGWDETSIDAFQAEVMKKLSPRCRRAYYLVRVEGLSHERAAELMGISHRTVETHILVANRAFRAELQLVGVPVRAPASEAQQSTKSRERSARHLGRETPPAGQFAEPVVQFALQRVQRTQNNFQGSIT
jgi:DNA-directed RNA polymerase specialized sigma24 family protein